MSMVIFNSLTSELFKAVDAQYLNGGRADLNMF